MLGICRGKWNSIRNCGGAEYVSMDCFGKYEKTL